MSKAKMHARGKLYSFAEKKGMPKMAMGGRMNEDDEWGDYSPHVSSGEPGTNEYDEDEHPMEYMALGGIPGVGENFAGPTSESQEDPDMMHEDYAGMEDEDGMLSSMGDFKDNDQMYTQGEPKHIEVDYNLAHGGKLPKLGSGKRFANLKNELSHESGVTDPGALAASIGRKKFGTEKMSQMAAKGRARKMSAGGAVAHAFAHALKRGGMR